MDLTSDNPYAVNLYMFNGRRGWEEQSNYQVNEGEPEDGKRKTGKLPSRGACRGTHLMTPPL